MGYLMTKLSFPKNICWGNKGVNTFPKGKSPKICLIERPDFKPEKYGNEVNLCIASFFPFLPFVTSILGLTQKFITDARFA